MRHPPLSASGRCRQCDRPITTDRAAGLCVVCVSHRLTPSQETPSQETVPLPPGFELVEILGHGGMGEVYLVYQASLSRYVAMKLLSGAWQRNPRARDRFVREAQTAARLSHSGIVPIIEIGTQGERLWYTMEYVDGGDLAQHLSAQGGRLPWREAVELVVRIAESIQHAHAAGIAHRDLKPSNILLDSTGAPKVADFGVAWIAIHEGKDLTVTGEVLGTPAYLPPEYLSPARATDPRRGDIYSLGALLYHLVAGQPPFAGSHPAEILSAIAHLPAPRLSSLKAAGEVPPALDELCARCLQKRPADRYASAAELVSSLRACARGKSSITLRFQFRRFRWIAAGVLAGTVLVVGARWGGGVVRPFLARFQTAAAAPLIAIAPLETLTPDDATTLLARGLQDEIAATLVRISDVKVIATRSTRNLSNVGADFRSARESLGADAILTGRVRKWEDKVWAAVQLTNTLDGTIRWSRTYILRETNALNLQTDIATDIAIHLNRRLRQDHVETARGTASRISAAQGRYTQARTLMTDASDSVGTLTQAEALLEGAVNADPAFALAYARLSLVHTQMFHWGNDRSDHRLRLGLEAAQKALQLNPDLAEGEIALGHYYFRGSRDYGTAQRHLDRAIALSPNFAEALEALAHVERRQGFFRPASVHFESALQLDPLNAILAYNTADTFLRLRDYEKASAILNRSLSLLPSHVALLKLRGDLYVAWKGDIGPMHDDTEHRDRTLPTPDLFLMDRIDYLILAHRLDEALTTLRASQLTVLEGQSIYLIRDGYEALLLQLAGQAEAARPLARRALIELQRELEQRPNDSRVLLHAAQMHAIVGEFAEADRLIQRILTVGDLACADGFDRGFYRRSYAILLALAGEDARAIAQIRLLLSEPNQTSPLFLSLHPALAKYSKEFL